MIICDFCNSPEVKWRYPTKSFEFVFGVQSEGDWAACDVCHELIEQNQNELLMQRALVTVNFPFPEPEDMMIQLHDLFRANRIGNAVPHV